MNVINNHAENYKWLKNYTQCFVINSNDIEILYEPNEFYQNLKKEFSQCKKRIVISSLYLGSGQLEKELVEAIGENMNNNAQLKLKMILDYSRYLRAADKSREYLNPLIKKFTDRFNLFLYHTPNLRGLAKKMIPERSNESLGVLHMKIYIADNNLIISGANLSNDYFTNRQDRYFILRNCEKLCNYLELLIDTISEFSFRVNNHNVGIEYVNSNHLTHPYLGDRHHFKENFSLKIREFLQSNLNEKEPEADDSLTKAYVYPLLQINDAGVNIDETVTKILMEKLPKSENDQISLAVGYFNLTEDYMQSIVKKSIAKYNILVSSPEANGFFNSHGFSNNIPKIYSHFEEEFFKFSQRFANNRINIYEYKKDNWTFHAKGFWFTPQNNTPNMTIIGSSNYGYRSVYRDPELNLLIHSKCDRFRKNLEKERNSLFEKYTTLVTQEIFLNNQSRVLPLWLKLFCRTFKSYF